MKASDRVAELERKLVAAHEHEPYLKILVMQLSGIAKTALDAANAQWPRHDKRTMRDNIPDMFG